jgi:hypothetical protein
VAGQKLATRGDLNLDQVLVFYSDTRLDDLHEILNANCFRETQGGSKSEKTPC